MANVASAANRKAVLYKTGESHLLTIALYLKKLHDNGDLRSCDVELRTDGGKEKIHSAVLAAHSPKVAKLLASSNDNLRIDMSGFRKASIAKVIHWLYNGEVELLPEHLADDLSTTNYLGVTTLHEQLEATLRNMACSNENRIEAMNIATNPKCGVSTPTKNTILAVIYEKQFKITAAEIMCLQPWTVKALVSASVSRPVKIALINLALNWIRHPKNLPWLDGVLRDITIADMNYNELNAFKKTIRTALRNPTTRRYITISIDKLGRVAIRSDKQSFYRNAGKYVDNLEPKASDIAQQQAKDIVLLSAEDSEEDDDDLPSYRVSLESKPFIVAEEKQPGKSIATPKSTVAEKVNEQIKEHSVDTKLEKPKKKQMSKRQRSQNSQHSRTKKSEEKGVLPEMKLSYECIPEDIPSSLPKSYYAF
ncbi:unnamed protein product [Cylicocyclus nassatus]|uniref:BTB domain-containing protein n=1 Tax=Cylicocyclus nassatus TaxID=53992 RepID=A0AA36M9B1_CYLNA|nr:unnamed protein product [Cylicocyclus nassatus]